MKKIVLVLFLGTFLLAGCGDKTEKSAHSEMKEILEDEHQLSDADSHHSATNNTDYSWIDDIQLDEGKLWMANPETVTGVERMKNNIQTTTLDELGDYHSLAEKLNEDKNYIVKECTMEGPSHDNLHIWLHPLIEKIEQLSKVESPESGQNIVDDIEESLTRFYDYFK